MDVLENNKPKKIVVAGLWHLGCVTAACLAGKSFNVLGFDPDKKMIENAKKGLLPIFEPGLDDLTKHVSSSGYLKFSNDTKEFKDADIVWITFDTPVNDKDEADTKYVTDFVRSIFSYLQNETIVIVSSQLPVGTVQVLDKEYRKQYPQNKVYFTSSPENLRLGKAIDIFTNPDRIVLGLDDLSIKPRLESLLCPFSTNILWVSVASAEMIKHAINAFLAVSVTFINELASICESVGANAAEVEKGLKTEERIGPKAYLKPGSAFAGGTLARDIDYLVKMSNVFEFPAHLMNAIQQSNDHHKSWVVRRLNQLLGVLAGKKIAVMGLTYKPGTNTLRRSSSIETCRSLTQSGAEVLAFDPVINELPAELDININLKNSFKELSKDIDAIVVATEWPEFKDLELSKLNCSYLLDMNGFLAEKVPTDVSFKYISLGRG